MHGWDPSLVAVIVNRRKRAGTGGKRSTLRRGLGGGRLGEAIVRLERVASELFEDKPRVRRIVVEAADDVVAIGPGIGAEGVHLVAVALGEAGDVEPVPRPALAVVWTLQQAVEQC